MRPWKEVPKSNHKNDLGNDGDAIIANEGEEFKHYTVMRAGRKNILDCLLTLALLYCSAAS